MLYKLQFVDVLLERTVKMYKQYAFTYTVYTRLYMRCRLMMNKLEFVNMLQVVKMCGELVMKCVK